jgi:hypothetical protein
MAERPRYRPLGADIPSIPTVDYAATGRAQARVFESVARGLDVMSRYVATQEEARTKREAAQWAFENPLTIEQLEAAKAGGISIDSLIGDRDTVFGSVSAATLAEKLTADLEGQARGKLAEYTAQIAGGASVDVNAMSTDIKSMVDGHSDLIAQIDPSLASKYSASIATIAAPVYRAGLERKYKIEQAVKKNELVVAQQQLGVSLRNIFDQDRGMFVDGGTRLESIEEADKQIKILEGMAVLTNDADIVKSTVDEAYKVRDEIIKGAVIDHVFEDEFALSDIGRISKLRQGNFGDKTGLFNSLPAEQQAAIRSSIRERISAREADMKINQEQMDDNDAVAFAGLVQRYNDAAPGSDDEMALEDQMFDIAIRSNNRVTNPSAINGIASAKRTRLASNDKEPTNKVGAGILTGEIYNGVIQSNAQLQARARELDVLANDYAPLYSKIEEFKDKDKRRGVAKIQRAAKISPGSGAVPTGTQMDKLISYTDKMEDIYKERYQEWESGGMIGPAPSYEAIADEITTAAQESKFTTAIENKFGLLSGTYPKLAAYFNEERFQELLDIVTDTELLETMGLSKNEIKLLQNQYQQDARFIQNNIDARDGL